MLEPGLLIVAVNHFESLRVLAGVGLLAVGLDAGGAKADAQQNPHARQADKNTGGEDFGKRNQVDLFNGLRGLGGDLMTIALVVLGVLVVEDEARGGSDDSEDTEKVDEDQGILFTGTELQCAENENGESKDGNVGSEMENVENDSLFSGGLRAAPFFRVQGPIIASVKCFLYSPVRKRTNCSQQVGTRG